MNLDRHIDLFQKFSSSHLTGNTDHDYYIQLKIDHSLRVLENGQTIVKKEGLTGQAADLSILASLYHDIGRFPQFDRYKTYKDGDSVHHGRMGVLTLRDLNLPDNIPPEQWRLIRAAVGLHNAKQINPNTTGLLRTMVDVVRDADKLDIYDVILDHLCARDNPQNIVIHSLEEHPTKYTKSVFETVFSEGICDYGMLRYSNDFILLLVGWLFSLVYPTSIDLLSQRKLMEKAFSLLPRNAEIRSLEEKIFIFIRYKTHSPS